MFVLANAKRKMKKKRKEKKLTNPGLFGKLQFSVDDTLAACFLPFISEFEKTKSSTPRLSNYNYVHSLSLW